MICTDFKALYMWKATVKFSQGDQMSNCEAELQLDFVAALPHDLCVTLCSAFDLK